MTKKRTKAELLGNKDRGGSKRRRNRQGRAVAAEGNSVCVVRKGRVKESSSIVLTRVSLLPETARSHACHFYFRFLPSAVPTVPALQTGQFCFIYLSLLSVAV